MLMKKFVYKLLILLLLGAGFFCFRKAWANQNILISEIQIYPTGNRFIELYNPNDSPINLTGWYIQRKTQTGSNFASLVSKTNFENKIINARGYVLISRNASGEADIFLDNLTITESNVLQLKNSNGEIIDKVGWGQASDCENNCAPELSNNQSIQRKFQNNIFIDTDNNAEDFEIQGCPNPKAQLSACQIEGGEQPTPPSETAPIIPPQTDTGQSEINIPQEKEIVKHYNLGDIVINEFVSDPADEEVEWIELYNTQSADINLDGWTIEEGSGAKTALSNIIAGSGGGKFKVIEKPKGNINNSGDIIILRDSKNNLIDQAVYGDWDDGDIKNNAPAAKDPNSTARKIDGANNYNNADDFAATATPTKGASNIINNEEDEKKNYDYNDKIIITEIFPNPQGDDSRNEFIELYNASDKDADLIGWRLEGKNSQSEFGKKIKTAALKAKKYLAVYRSESGLALNNNGDTVKFYRPLENAPAQTIKYEKAEEGLSYAANGVDNQWSWTQTVTPGKANIIKTINRAPVVDFNFPEKIVAGQHILFDSSDTFDENGDALTYEWDFGDKIKSRIAGPDHTFVKAGNYTVKLSANDGKSTTSKEKIIKVGKSEALSADTGFISALLKPTGQQNNKNKIIINEFLPNPEGDDADGEWIELKNTGNEKVNLLNWKIDDGEGGSKPYKFPETWINNNNFFVLPRAKSGLALNNTGDSVRLFNDLDELIDEMDYEAAAEGAAFARDSKGAWHWTTVLTPQAENVFANANESKKAKSSSSAKKKTKQIIATSLEKIREFEPGDSVRVKGTVLVKPGILGAQIFYIAGSPGIQVYNYKKDFPALNVGDYVEISGEISVSADEQRIKTSGKDDIKLIEHRPAPNSIKLACENVNEEYLGQLVEISGEVTERKSSTVILDDGTNEAVVYIKKATGIRVASIKAGDKIAVAGIVGKTSSGVRVMPRFDEDIVRKDAESAGQVLGETAVNDEWEIAKRDKKLELFKYLLVLAGGVLIVLIGMLIRMKKIVFSAKRK